MIDTLGCHTILSLRTASLSGTLKSSPANILFFFSTSPQNSPFPPAFPIQLIQSDSSSHRFTETAFMRSERISMLLNIIDTFPYILLYLLLYFNQLDHFLITKPLFFLSFTLLGLHLSHWKLFLSLLLLSSKSSDTGLGLSAVCLLCLLGTDLHSWFQVSFSVPTSSLRKSFIYPIIHWHFHLSV